MKPIIRVCCFVLSFFLSIPISPFSLNAEPPAPAGTLSIADLALPESLGKIDERFTGTSDRWVVYIQDVHAHLTAQENISAIIDHLHSIYGIKNLGLEGGWSKTSFKKSWGLPPSKAKHMLARALLEDAYITGPAFSALFSPMPLNLVGLEKAELYNQSLEVYRAHLGQRERIQSSVTAAEDQIKSEKKNLYHPDLLTFDENLAAFREGKKAEKFLPALFAAAESKAVDISDLSQVTLFQSIQALEKSLDKEKLKSEAKRLSETFKNKHLHFEELLRGGIVPADQLEFYPQSKKYLEIMKLQDQIAHRIFFSEIETAIQRLKEKLFITDEERALDARSERFSLMKKILLFQATTSDLKAYEDRKETADAEMAAYQLTPYVRPALEFYDLALKRDEIFFEKISSDKDLSGNIAIVTGGFHSEGLRAHMEKAGISYVLITPSLGDQAPDEELYHKRLQDKVVARQTFDPNQNRTFMTDRPFPVGVAVISKTNPTDTPKGMEVMIAFYEGKSLASFLPREEGAVPKGINPIDFLKADQEGRMKQGRLLLQQIRDRKTPIILVARTSSFQKLFEEDPEKDKALTVFDQFIASERMNTIAEVRDLEIFLDPLVSTKARIQRIEGNDIAAVIAQHFADPKQQKLIVIIDDEAKTGFPTLREQWPSFVLARLAAELGASMTPEFMGALEEVFRAILFSEEFEQAA